jgi:hypothetical protein
MPALANAFVAASIALLLLPSCGSDEATPGAPPSGDHAPEAQDDTPVAPRREPVIRSFTARPSSLPAGGGKVELHYEVLGAYAVTIDNGVGDVSGTSWKEVEVAQSTSFTLTASNETGEVTATTSASVTAPLDVSGTVVAWGQPLSGVDVSINGKPPVATGSAGTFTVKGVKVPYDVAIATSGLNVTVYRGLTRPDPTLVAFGRQGPPMPASRAAGIVSGTVSAPGRPPFANAPIVTVGGPDRPAGRANANATTGAFTMPSPSWYGPTTIAVTMHASYVANGEGFYGRLTNWPLTDSSNEMGFTIPMAAVGVAELSVRVTGPAAFSGSDKVESGFGIRFDDGGGYEQLLDELPISVVALAPRATGATVYALGWYNRLAEDAEWSGARRAAPVAPKVTLLAELPLPPRPSSPADGATVTPSTPFELSAFTGGVHRVVFYENGGPMTVTVFTRAASMTLPDTSSLGVAIPKGTPYRWRTFGYAPLASLDDPALAEALDVPDGSLPPRAASAMAAGAPRTFTIAP